MASASPELRAVRATLLSIAEDPASSVDARTGALQLLQEIRGGTPTLLRLLAEQGEALRKIDAGPGRGSLRAEVVRALGARTLAGDAAARTVLRSESLRRGDAAYATPFLGPLWRSAHLGLIAQRDPRALAFLLDGLTDERARTLLLAWMPPAQASELLGDHPLAATLPTAPRFDPSVLGLATRLADEPDLELILDELSLLPEDELDGICAVLLLLIQVDATCEPAIEVLRGVGGPRENRALLSMLAAAPDPAAEALASLVGTLWDGGPGDLVAALGAAGERVRWDTTPPQERARRALLALQAAGLPLHQAADVLGPALLPEQLVLAAEVLPAGMSRIRFLDRAAVSSGDPALAYGAHPVPRWWASPCRGRAVLRADPVGAGSDLRQRAEQDPLALLIADQHALCEVPGAPPASILEELLEASRDPRCRVAAGRRLVLRSAHRPRGLLLLDKARTQLPVAGRSLAWALALAGDRRGAAFLRPTLASDPRGHMELLAAGEDADEPAAAWGNDPRAALGRALAPTDDEVEALVARAWLHRAATLGHAEACARLAEAGVEPRHFARRALDLDRGVPPWGPLN